MTTTRADLSDTTERRQRAFDQLTRRTEIPMLVLSVLFLAGLVTPVIDTQLSGQWRHAIAVGNTAIWAIFLVEYVARFVLSPRRLHFVLHNIPDLVVVAVPVLRPLRLARLARVVRVASLASGVSRRGHSRMHLDIAYQVTAVAVIITFVGAVGVLDVERKAPGSTIHSFGDASWWALTTITTVGYGDKVPVTGQGKLIAAALMLTGIAVLGVVTASVAGWFVDNLQTIQRQEAAEASRTHGLEAQMTELLDRMARIEAHLSANTPGNAPPNQSGS